MNYHQRWYRENREYALRWQHDYGIEHRRESAAQKKIYRASHPEVNRKAVAKWAQSNPWKVRAHNKLKLAVRKGEISRPDHCQSCGLICKPQAHHPDYSKALEVLWLCAFCHKQKHARSCGVSEELPKPQNLLKLLAESLRIAKEKKRHDTRRS